MAQGAWQAAAPLTPAVTGDSDGTRTLASGDNGDVIDVTHASANAVAINTDFDGLACTITWPASAAPPVLTPTGVTLNGASDAITGAAGPGMLAILPTGTDAFRVVGSIRSNTKVLPIGIGDETTALTTGTGKFTFRMPYAMTVTAVRASVTTAPTGAALTVDINDSGTTILSTKLTIDASEKTSATAATPAVISDAALADDAEITIDIDQVGSTIAGAGLKVCLIGY